MGFLRVFTGCLRVVYGPHRNLVFQKYGIFTGRIRDFMGRIRDFTGRKWVFYGNP